MRTLDPRHRAELEASGISEEAILARGYWTATTKTQLGELGFSVGQRLVPALVLPLYSPSGDLAGYQIKPDHPRVNGGGKPSKYEFPKHSKMILDVPKASRPMLGDPKIPLIITEGIKKADAAASHGLCCVALLGVWNWRGTNADGGKMALPEWEMVALNDRDARIAFDSDVMVNTNVHGSLARLGEFLKHRKGGVQYIYLPHGPNGEKVGLDDYLATHSTDELFALATPHLRESGEQAVIHDRFVIENGCIKQSRMTENGTVLTPLANFTATVKEEIVLDDNVTKTRAYLIEGAHESGRAFPSVRVPAAKFPDMKWTNEWGTSAIIRCGAAPRDAVREAIQTFSGGAAERTIYTHTGWRRIDDCWTFLMPNTAVGLDRAVEVEIAQRYRGRYALPHAPEYLKEAIRISLATMDVVPDSVSMPLWAAMFRAVLSSVLQHDLTVWIAGQTGSMKSTYAALQLSHFGSFQYDTLPENWSSTVNALEKSSHELMDLPLVVDDYAPGPLDRREMESKAGRLLRSQGNSAGRSRLRPDLTEAPMFKPRGLVIVTGESFPTTGQSANARSLRLEMRREDVSLPRLDVAQANAARLPHAMSGFAQWLIPQMESLPQILKENFQTLRSYTGKEIQGAHHRVIANVAHLLLGADLAIAYAVDSGAIGEAQAQELTERAKASILEAGRKTSVDLAEERPTTRFLRLLATLILQRQVWVKPAHNHFASANDPGADKLVGWYDCDHIYLNPEAAHQAVTRFAQSAGEPFPISQDSLRDALVKEGVAHVDGAGRRAVRETLDGVRQRVLKLGGITVAKILGHDLLGFACPDDPAELDRSVASCGPVK